MPGVVSETLASRVWRLGPGAQASVEGAVSRVAVSKVAVSRAAVSRVLCLRQLRLKLACLFRGSLPLGCCSRVLHLGCGV